MTGIWGIIDFSGPVPTRSELPESPHSKLITEVTGPNRVLGLSLPLVSADRDGFAFSSTEFPWLFLVGNIHLFNGDDLRRAVNSISRQACEGDDGMLVIAAYAKWGAECTAFLYGQFSFAIWDERAKRLFLAQDHVGSLPLCFWQKGSRFLFASDSRVLLGFPEVPRKLNRAKLASIAFPNGRDFHDQQTFHAEVMSMRPASQMTIDERGLGQRTYWKPGASPVEIPKREPEAFEALRDLLFSGVEHRIRGLKSVSALLSGGLDSSAVVSMAAICLAKKNRTLTAISSVLPDESLKLLRDEREFIDEFRSWPNVRIEYVTALGRGPFDRICDLARFEASFMRSSRDYLYETFEEVALSGSADVVLDGLGGEQGPTTRGSGYYLELATKGRWAALASELNALRNASLTTGSTPRSPLRAIGGEFLDLINPTRGAWQGQPIPFTREFIKEGAAGASMRDQYWPDHRRRQMNSIQRVLGMHANLIWEAPQRRVPFSYPFMDKRVLEFCLAMPGSMKIKAGYPRYLVRGALDSVLPPRIQWRTSKLPFSPDYFLRYNAQLPIARSFVESIGPKDPVRSVIDVAKYAELLQPVDPFKPNMNAIRAPRTIQLICFLRQFAEFRI